MAAGARSLEATLAVNLEVYTSEALHAVRVYYSVHSFAFWKADDETSETTYRKRREGQGGLGNPARDGEARLSFGSGHRKPNRAQGRISPPTTSLDGLWDRAGMRLSEHCARVPAGSSHQGEPGVEGMTVHDWSDWLRDNQLGIPVVVDRLVQPMILPRLEPLLDPAFSPSSYGFRPGESRHPQGPARAPNRRPTPPSHRAALLAGRPDAAWGVRRPRGGNAPGRAALPLIGPSTA
jgi:hypothetical protein